MKILTLILIIFFSAELFAAPLSDLNVKGFKERTAPSVSVEKNPFVPRKPLPQDMIVEDLHLTGIIYDPYESYALISGYAVKEGDEVAGYKVKVIERDHVVLRQLDQVHILKLE